MKLTIIVVSVLVSRNAQAQQPDPGSYFPLDVGNEWTYIEVLFPPFSPPDTLWDGPHTIVGTQNVNDTLYFAFNSFVTLATQFRTNGEGKIWGRMNDADQLVFDFTLPEGQSYFFSSGPTLDDKFEVTVERGLQVDVAAGHFDNVVIGPTCSR